MLLSILVGCGTYRPSRPRWLLYILSSCTVVYLIVMHVFVCAQWFIHLNNSSLTSTPFFLSPCLFFPSPFFSFFSACGRRPSRCLLHGTWRHKLPWQRCPRKCELVVSQERLIYIFSSFPHHEKHTSTSSTSVGKADCVRHGWLR